MRNLGYGRESGIAVMGWIDRYRSNYALLRRAADEAGRRFERKPYHELAGGRADESGGEFAFEGVPVRYSAYSVEVHKKGDVRFCIDVTAELPTLLGVKPSYEFWKRPDGSVYYGRTRPRD
jgi:hypothetical protein